jgi:chitin disaccharide deacetylase
MTRLILCADDYGLAPGVSRAILRLLAAGRLSATSCMSLGPAWAEHAAALKPHAETADIGLHLTLTDHRPLGPMPGLAPEGELPPVGALLARTLIGRIDRAEIAQELERQLDAFEREFGRPPAFLDGHQHVHQFPILRDAVVDLWQRRLSRTGAWMRVCVEPWRATLKRGVDAPKAWVITGLGRGLRGRARAAGVPTNDRFSGIHDFSGRISYAALFEKFVHEAGPETLLVMCHPGEVDAELVALDPVTTAREEELRFFESAEFPALLARSGLTLGRLRD